MDGTLAAEAALLSPRFEEALAFAARLHARQRRKGTDVPYVAHLLAVTALVLEAGGDEDEAIAALLHDAVEDQGGAPTLAAIEQRFGPRVAGIVAACSDTDETPKPPWRARKERHLAHLRTAPPAVRRVVVADKLHNARGLIVSLRREGPSVWTRFRGGRDGTLWYYRSAVEVLSTDRDNPHLVELASVVAELERVAREG
jgi:(p)ppGpp synthase/HD superfamily hydrolase